MYGVDELVFGTGVGARIVRSDLMFGPTTEELRVGR
jgi:hypothetical protein